MVFVLALRPLREMQNQRWLGTMDNTGWNLTSALRHAKKYRTMHEANQAMDMARNVHGVRLFLRAEG